MTVLAGLLLPTTTSLSAAATTGAAVTVAVTTTPASGSTVAPGSSVTFTLAAEVQQPLTTNPTVVDDLSGLLGNATVTTSPADLAKQGLTLDTNSDTLSWLVPATGATQGSTITASFQATVSKTAPGGAKLTTAVALQGGAACTAGSPCAATFTVADPPAPSSTTATASPTTAGPPPTTADPPSTTTPPTTPTTTPPTTAKPTTTSPESTAPTTTAAPTTVAPTTTPLTTAKPAATTTTSPPTTAPPTTAKPAASSPASTPTAGAAASTSASAAAAAPTDPPGSPRAAAADCPANEPVSSTAAVVGGFEIDGNLCVNTAGNSDWTSTPGQPAQQDGTGDSTAFTGGASEDNWPWTASQVAGRITGSGSAQQDINDVYATTESVDDQVYTFFAFSRAGAGMGTLAIYVELNQRPNMAVGGLTSAQSPVPDRTDGDLRLKFLKSGGGAIALAQAATWSTSQKAWVPLPSLAGFTGATNDTGAVTNLPGLTPNPIPQNQFSEVAVNLTQLFGTASDPNNCSGNFGVMNIRSSASDTESTALIDWVAPTDLSVPSTCASVRVDKTWDIDGTTFPNGEQPDGFNSTLSLDPAPELTADETNPSFGVTYPTQSDGTPYQAGESLTVGETQTLPPGCVLTSQGGGGVGTHTLEPGVNTFQVTNVVTCTHLTLQKVVDGGTAVPADWTLTATGPTSITGTSGSDAVTNALIGNGTYTLTEANGPADYQLQPLTCSDSTGAAVPVTGDTVTISQGTNVTCTFTNAAQHSLTLSKTWTNAHNGDVVSLTAQVGTTTETATSTAPNSNTTAPLPTIAGDTVTLSETFTSGLPANYTTTLACNGTPVTPLAPTTTPGNGGQTATFTVPSDPGLAAGAPIACTFTNTGKSTTLTVQKTWVNGAAGDTANFQIVTEATTAASTSTSEGIAGSFTDTAHVATAPIFSGESVTVTDTPGAGNTGTYTPTLSCVEADGTAVTVTFSLNATTGAGTGTFTAPAANVTCTFTNTRTSATLTLQKTWDGAVLGDSATLSVTGGSPTPNPVPSGTSTVTNTTTQTDVVLPSPTFPSVTIFSGDTLTFDEEFGADNAGAYTSTSACTGPTTRFRSAIGGEGGTFTVPNIPPGTTGASVTCTITNTRATTGVLVLQKNWQGGAVASGSTPADTAGLSVTTNAGPDAGMTTGPVTATVPGGGNGISEDKVVDVPITAADDVTLTETLPDTNRGVYTSTLTCVQDGTTTTVPTTSSGTPATGVTVTGTYTVRAPAMAGGQSNPVCTFTNTRGQATLTLQKTWVNGANGDTSVLNIAGSDPETSAASTSMDTSTATGVAGDFTDTAHEASAPIFGGETVTVTELLGADNTGSYDSQLECVAADGTTVLPTTPGIEGEFTVPVTATPADVTCTFTNTRTSTTLHLEKVWVNGAAGDTAALSIVGPAPPAAGAGPAVNQTATSTAPSAPVAANTATATVYSGQALTLSETLPATGTNTGIYSSALACTSNGSTLLDASGTSHAFAVPSFTTNTPPNAAITCTFTNTRNQAQLVVMKAWDNGFAGDTATMTASGSGLTATQTATSTATGVAGNELDTSTGHFIMTTILSGGTVNLAETFPAAGSANANTGTYTATLSCVDTGTTPPTTVITGTTTGSFTVGANPTDITCTFTNTRTSTPLNLTKVWNDGIPRDGVQLTITQGTGAAERTATGTSTVPGAQRATVPATLDILSGEPVTVEESFIDGEGANYISTLACEPSPADLAVAADGLSGTFTAPANPTNDQSPITCTFTNSQAALHLMKSADVTSVSAAGDVITYSFTVTNTGGAPLTDIAVTDTGCLPGTSTTPCTNGAATTVDGCPTTLAPGASATCTGTITHTVTAADVTAGAILDTATATATATQAGATKPVDSNPWSVSVDVRPPQSGFTSIVVNTTNTLHLES